AAPRRAASRSCPESISTRRAPARWRRCRRWSRRGTLAIGCTPAFALDERVPRCQRQFERRPSVRQRAARLRLAGETGEEVAHRIEDHHVALKAVGRRHDLPALRADYVAPGRMIGVVPGDRTLAADDGQAVFARALHEVEVDVARGAAGEAQADVDAGVDG